MSVFRLIWNIPGTPFPTHEDHSTSSEAHRERQRIERADPNAKPSVHEIQESA